MYDFNIKYNSKQLQTIQNTALYIVFNQHALSYDLKDSTETLLFRLSHRRRLHMISFIVNYTDKYELLDVRDINTRRRDGILFSVESMNNYNYKARQDPMYRAMMTWNSYLYIYGMLKRNLS